MDISKKDMDEYHRRLSQVQEKSKATFKRLVEAGLKANPAMGDEEFLKLVEKSMISTTLSFGDAASSVALDFFTNTTGFSANSSDMARLPFGVNDSFSDHVKEYAGNNNIRGQKFLEACGNLVESETLQQANRTTGKVGAKNGLKFARVPQGNECSFCAMLASLGFYYTEAGAYSHYHDHCKCKIVAGKQGTKVGGYNPRKYLKEWQEVEHSQFIAEMKSNKYSNDEIKKFDEIFEKLKDVVAGEKFFNNLGIDVRDFRSVGMVYQTLKEKGLILSRDRTIDLVKKQQTQRDLIAYIRFVENGHFAENKPEPNKNQKRGKMDIDAIIDGSFGEIKSITSIKRNAIERSCLSTVSKFNNLSIEPSYLILNTTYIDGSIDEEYYSLISDEKRLRNVERITVVLKNGDITEI
nr:MAG TPA: minor capsid protein [Caudoviricetes sp.]